MFGDVPTGGLHGFRTTSDDEPPALGLSL